jgi:tetratricopeptide (TPR) repeat protein
MQRRRTSRSANRPKSSLRRGEPTSPAGRSWVWAAALVLLVVVVYWPTLANGFVWDDEVHVASSSDPASPASLRTIWVNRNSVLQYYPLTQSTFWTEYRLWGLDPLGYHVVNLLLHAVTVLFAWRLLTRLGVPGAWLAAAIFAVHPVEVESVAWVTEQKNMLSCALALASILAYLRFSPPEAANPAESEVSPQQGAWRYYGLALGLFIAALLSNTVTATVPAVLLVVYWWKQGRVPRREIVGLAPFFAIGLALSVVTIGLEKTHIEATGQVWSLSPLDRLLVGGRALWFYADKIVWPQPLIFFYPRWPINSYDPWQYLYPAAALAVLVSLWLARKRIGRGPLAAVLIFAGVLTPVLGYFDIFSFRYSFAADRFQYHASIALIALAAAVLARGSERLGQRIRWLSSLAVICLLLLLSAVAEQRTLAYHDRDTLYDNTLALNPDAWVIPEDLGNFLRNHGKNEQAIPWYRKAIEIRTKLVSDEPTLSAHRKGLAGCYSQLALALQHSGKAAEAEASHREAIKLYERLVSKNPGVGAYKDSLAASYVDLGFLYRDVGRTDEATASFRKAIETREQLVHENPTVSDYQEGLGWCYVNLAMVQQKAGNSTAATVSYRKAIQVREKLAGDNHAVAKYQNNLAASFVDLALLQYDLGQPSAAARSFQNAIETREQLVRDQPAASEYQESVGLTYLARALAEEKTGQRAEAAVAYGKAAEVRRKLADDNPANGDYQNNAIASYLALAALQRELGQLAEAAVSYRKAIKIRQRLADADPSNGDYQNDVATIYVDLGILLRDLGQTAEAVDSCQKAAEIREKLVSDFSTVPNYQAGLGWSYANLGIGQLASGRPADAVISCQKAVAIREKLVSDFPDVTDYRVGLGWSYANLGAAQMADGQPTEAIASHRKATNIRAMLVEDDPTADGYKHEIAMSCRDIGDALRATGQVAEAVGFYQTAIEIDEKLATDYPTNTVCQLNLANDLVPCGEALALLGQWPESADMYAKAAKASNHSRQTLWPWALMELAAGNEASYRATCAELVTRYGGSTAPDALFSLALTLVLGKDSLEDMNQVLLLAKRAADANPSDPMAPILVGAAECRAGHSKEAVASLTTALAQLDQTALSTADDAQRTFVGRLLGEMLLALAYREQANSESLKQQIETLQKLVDQPATTGTQAKGALPLWVAGCVIELVKHELVRIRGPVENGTSMLMDQLLRSLARDNRAP